jgi:hypothetical protein
MPDLNWKTADELCRNYTFTDGTVSHLISFESQAESIAITYWLKGFIIGQHFLNNSE